MTLNQFYTSTDYAGLFEEVERFDVYKIKELDFVPDKVIDMGANIGVFTRFARTLWPDARIISVEPHEPNCELFLQYTDMENVILLNMAIGIGQVYHGLTARNGSGETYLSAGLGYPKEIMDEEVVKENGIEYSFVKTIMPDFLIKEFVKEGQKFVVKMDIEGNENLVLTHEPSMEALRKADYLCFEIHRYAIVGGEIFDEVQEKVAQALESFSETHNISYSEDKVHFYARKK